MSDDTFRMTRVPIVPCEDVTPYEPTRATVGSAAYDLHAAESLSIRPSTMEYVRTGWSMEIPRGYVGLITPRSSLFKKFGLILPNSPGLIDSDYRGEVMVIVYNLSPYPSALNDGDRIAQLLITPAIPASFNRVSQLNTTSRGDGGFGSTGN